MQMSMYPPLKFRKFFCIFPFWLETFYKSLLSCNIQYLQYFVCIKLKCTLKNLPQHPVLELGPVDAFESTRVQHRVMSFLCLCLLAPRPLPPNPQQKPCQAGLRNIPNPALLSYRSPTACIAALAPGWPPLLSPSS